MFEREMELAVKKRVSDETRISKIRTVARSIGPFASVAAMVGSKRSAVLETHDPLF